MLKNNVKDVRRMLHDPKYKDEIYQSGYYDDKPDALRDEFEYFYERKLDSFQDKLDDLSDVFNPDDTIHPDKLLARYDKKTTEYLTTKVFPFFKEMVKYYGPKIMDVYQEYIDQVAEERDSFVKFEYEDMLKEFIEEQEYKKLCLQYKKQIVEILKKHVPMKPNALINSFPKEEQKIVKDCLKYLMSENRVFRVRKDMNKKGSPWFLVLGEHRYDWRTFT